MFGTINNSGRTSSASSRKNTSNLTLITFDIYGEGHLPKMTLIEPTLRNQQGNVQCVFKQTRIGSINSQSLILKNDGVLNSRVSNQVKRLSKKIAT